MSKTVDERVVSMQFDNKQFESGAATSMSTLDKLMQKLKLTDATKGLEGVGEAAKKISFGNLASAAETVSTKFNALETIATGALLRIGSQAVQTGEQILKSLTIDPIKTGFNEYEEKMKSVQTMINNVDWSNTDVYGNITSDEQKLERVMSTLEEMNQYADDTIYSFSDMTGSMAKFINAGIDLDTASRAIKGIANEAALSGASAQEASRAYYNLAQSLSTGSLKLIDWKSIELANMATVEFKQAIIDTAKELGVLNAETESIGGGLDYMSITAENFRESISGVKGDTWVTNDVLLKTLEKFGMKSDEYMAVYGKVNELGDRAYKAATEVKTFTMLMDTLKEAAQSGWAITWETIVGDFYSARNMWTAVSDEIGGILDAQADKRNEVLKAWSDMGGREAALNGIADLWFSIKDSVFAVADAFHELFPSLNGSDLFKSSKAFESWAKSIREAFSNTEEIRKVAVRLLEPLKIVAAMASSGVKILKALGSAIARITKAVFTLIGKADYVKEAQTVEDICNGIYNVTNKLIPLIEKVSEKVAKFIETLDNNQTFKGFISSLSGLADGIKTKLSGILGKIDIGKITDKFKDAGSWLPSPSKIVEKVVELFNVVVRTITALLNGDYSSITDIFTNGGDNSDIDTTNTKLEKSATILERVTKWSDNLCQSIDTFRAALTEIEKPIEKFIKSFNWDSIAVFALDVGLIILVYKMFTWLERMAKLIGGIAGGLTSVLNSTAGVIAGFARIERAASSVLNGFAVVEFAFAIFTIATSIVMISRLAKEETLLESVGAIVTVMVALGAILAVLVSLSAKTKGFKIGNLKEIILALFAISTLALTLSIAIAAISATIKGTSGKAVIGAIGALETILWSLFGFLVALKILTAKPLSFEKISGTLLAISSSMLILSGVIKILSGINWGGDLSEDFNKTFKMMVSLMVGMAALVFVSGRFGDKGKAVLAAAKAMLIVVLALKLFLTIPWDTIDPGLVSGFILMMIGFAAGLVLMSIVVTSAAESLGIAAAGLGLGVLLFVFALKQLASAEGHVYAAAKVLAMIATLIAGGLAIVADYLTTKGADTKGILNLAKAGIALAAAVTIFALVATILGVLPLEVLAKGIGSLIFIVGLLAGLIAVTGKCNPQGSAKVFMGMALLLLSIVAAIAILSILDLEFVVITITEIILCVGMLIGLVGILGTASASKLQEIQKTIGVLIALLAAIAILFYVMNATAVNSETTIANAIAMGICVAAIVASVGIMSKLAKGGKKLVQMVAIAGILSAVLLAVAGAMYIMNGLDMKNAWISFGLLTATLVVIVGAIALVNVIAKNLVSLTVALIAMGVMTAIIAAIAGILYFMNGMDMLKALESVGILTLVMLAIVGVLAIIGAPPVALLLSTAAGVLALFGAAILVFAAAALVAAAAFGVFVIALNALGPALVSFSESLPMFFENLQLGILGMVEFLKTLNDSMPTINELGKSIVLQLAAGIVSLIPLLIEVAFLSILTFILGLSEAIDKFSAPLAEAIHKLIDSIVGLFVEILGINAHVSSVFADIGGSMVNGIIDAFKGTKLGQALEAASGLVDGIVGIVFNSKVGQKFQNAGKNISGEFSKGVEEGSKESEDASAQMADGIREGYKNRLDMHSPSPIVIDDAKYVPKSAAMGIDEATPEAVAATDRMGDGILDSIGSIKDKVSDAVSSDGGLLGGLTDNLGSLGKIDTSGLSGGFTSLFGDLGSSDTLEMFKGSGSDGMTAYLTGAQEGISTFGNNPFEGLLDSVDTSGGYEVGEEYAKNQTSGYVDYTKKNPATMQITPEMDYDTLGGLFSGGMDSSGTGTMNAVLDLDTESAKQEMWQMMEDVQLTKILGNSVNGHIDATYMSSAAEMQQQENMFNTLFERLAARFDSAIANNPVPQANITFNANANAKQLFDMTVDQNNQYKKRTGKSAYA